MSKRYYITTPIYYVNSVPHIGTALTTLAADITARYRRMRGDDPYFLTGTDENALKVLEKARELGRPTREFVDEMADEFKRIWQAMEIRYDDFIRTTEERHVRAVQEVFNRLRDSGHIYLGEYEGWYDVSSETFLKESELVDGKSPEGNEVRWVKEENYFFRLSAFQERLLSHMEQNPEFILPEVRRNEVMSFVRQGLRDACVTRLNPGWGISVPGDSSRVVYVWFDALVNYISAIGWPDGDWSSYWPADVEWMGKDILVRFHATLWPAMLMALGLPLPRTLIGHGWLLIGDRKISKSLGNVVAPLELAELLSRRSGCDYDVAVDAVRYYMARTMPFETDATYSDDDFDLKYNTELVNDISNGIHRVVSMLHNFCNGVIPNGRVSEQIEKATKGCVAAFSDAMQRFRIDEATAQVVALASVLNAAIDREKPWDLKKNLDPRLDDVMRSLVFVVQTIEGLCRPITPAVADRICGLLNLSPTTDWSDVGAVGRTPANHAVERPEPIYQRMEKKRDDAERSESVSMEDKTISIDEFAKVKLLVARVLDAQRVEGTDKLLLLQLVVGDERRQVLAGIAQQYTPEELLGRQVVLVANLQPRKLRGYESQGMILAADGPNGEAILIVPDKETPEGAPVH